MARSERKGYDRFIVEKANNPLARGLRDLVPSDKTSALAEALGCSVQAINQYKQGTAYPKTENLIKIADFCGVSVDYLLGITDIPTRNTTVQAIHEYTGLSEDAIEFLNYLNFHDDSIDTSYAEAVNKQTISFINRVLENEGKDAKRNEYDGGTEPRLTLFMKMERYVTCSDSTTARIGESSGNSISFDEEVMPLVGTAAYFYKAALMDEIKRHLDKYRDIETGGADNGIHTVKDK